MRMSVLSLQLICILTLICCPTACLSKKQTTSQQVEEKTIRYGENGVPNFIKGANLSLSLDNDPAFRNLKENNQYGEIVLHYLESQQSLFKLTSARDEFVINTVISDLSGQKHVRIHQVYQKIPVWGKDVIVHLNRANEIYYFHGNYQPISPHLAIEPAITKEVAGKSAISAKPDPARWRVENIDTCIWAPGNDVQRLAFKTTIIRDNFYREECFVDAKDKSILRCISATQEKENQKKINIGKD